MKKLKPFSTGILLFAVFLIWTAAVFLIDVQPIGPLDTEVGFASINGPFHKATGVHLLLYDLTDVLEYGAILICVCYGALGLWQWIRRKSLWKVDADIIALGVFYIAVIGLYAAFDIIALNYRPTLITGVLEPSYPSSTTLLVCSVIPTAIYQTNRRLEAGSFRTLLNTVLALYAAAIVIARLFSGVHWLTDIVAGLLLSAALVSTYRAVVALLDESAAKKAGSR